MRTAEEISKGYAEYKSLLYLREDASKSFEDFGHSAKCDSLKLEFMSGGAQGVLRTVSSALIREVVAKAYRDVIEAAIKNCEKRFKEAGIPLE